MKAGIFLAASAIVGFGGPALALGVGDATWTPDRTATTVEASRFLGARDALTFRTTASWASGQVDGLVPYLDDGLRYTHEVNDRSGRLSATGFWATNHPDPAFDRDDDDRDGRWEEAEVIAGRAPLAESEYTTLVQFSRWHAKRQNGRCEWAWDRRRGSAEVLSQLSRELLGEWQAERYTLSYGSSAYPRVDVPAPGLQARLAARCSDARPGPGQDGVTVTFGEPLAWDAFLTMPGVGAGTWTAFEAIGDVDGDERPWTCGGPVSAGIALRPCRGFGVRVGGVSAAVGYFDGAALEALRDLPQVARIDDLQDPLTGLLYGIGGLGVEAPGLTVNDAYWDLAAPEG